MVKLLALGLSGIVAASGAYVQTQNCEGGYTTQGLRAALSDRRDGQQDLKLGVADSVGEGEWQGRCETGDNKEEMLARLQIKSLGRVDDYDVVSSNYICDHGWGYFHFDAVAQPHYLDDLFLTVNFSDAENGTPTCVTAHLTPEIPSQFLSATTWIPIAVLALVIVVALWKEVASLSIDETEHLGPLIREASRAHVTRVADCLGYIQFIFLSSALSLYYPGFLQPITSRTSWSTLMFPTGMVQGHGWYSGSQDGIYVVNGTMSGTAGLDLMTQIVGGTSTFDTWLNIISLAAVIFALLVGIAYLGAKLTWVRDWFQATHALIFRSDSDGQGHLVDVLWTALRLFCAYLLLPLMTWTTYQLINVRVIPVHHSVMVSLFICFLVIVLWWAMQHFGPRNVGYLAIDNFKEHRTLASLSRTQNSYSIGVYAILVLRGVVHGVLQEIGGVQLLLLFGIEVIQVTLQAFFYKKTPFSTRSGAVPLIRLSILALQCGFLRDVVKHGPKMAIGYIILVIHALVLGGLFFVPALIDFGVLCKGALARVLGRRQAHQPPIYSLRQLNGRPNRSPQSPSAASSPDTLDAPLGTFFPRSSPRASNLAPTQPSRMPPLCVDAQGHSFFMPSRSSSVEPLSRASMTRLQTPSELKDSVAAVYPHAQLSSASTSPLSSNDNGDKSDRWSSVDVSSEEDGDGDGSWLDAASLIAPRADYAVREVDQYYIAPRRLSFNKAPEEGERDLSSKLRSFWTKK
jgi:hypothetical protein